MAPHRAVVARDVRAGQKQELAHRGLAGLEVFFVCLGVLATVTWIGLLGWLLHRAILMF